jgi:cytochrome c biogenesis protein CcdA/thiol-disulfide isomerase/thioredoxin
MLGLCRQSWRYDFKIMTILLIFAFISGLVTILAPCIWPLLPIVLSSSAIGGNHRRPLGITLGILLSFGILTLTISYLVSAFRFDPEILRYFAVGILLILGGTLIFPPLTRIIESIVSRFAGRVGQGGQNRTGFIGGFITGLALGVVWTPCAGPILAAIATLSATRAVNFQIVLVTIVYLIGVGIPLFIFAYAGQKVVTRSRFLNRYTGNIQKIFGVIIIVTAMLIATGYDRVLQAKLLDAVPAYSKFIVDLESNDTVQKQLENITGGKDDDMVGKAFNPMPGDKKSDLFNANTPAPNFIGITNWINSPPLKIEELKGKVVLVDFWTYTCINCIRTLPYVTSWYEKYKDDGFVVVGVHTPEFEFEKDTKNVENAMKQYGINYPVAQDNNYTTWNNYSNRYWPAKYLIDKNGTIRYVHFGEGEYDKTEMAIQKLLEEAQGSKLDKKLTEMPDETPTQRITPEIYLGSKRMQYFYPNGSTTKGTQSFTLAQNIPINSFTLGGQWDIQDEYSKAVNNGVLELKFYAKNVFLVLKPNSTSGTVRVFLDGNLENTISVDSDRLYDILKLPDYGEHTLKLEFSDGIEAFAFTFG